ncbi:MAG TPA: hypothetical protein VK168_11005 [Saprospiraceae bacterium]|nr:hypothetical protein [Saprospiraceae bacterium]
MTKVFILISHLGLVFSLTHLKAQSALELHLSFQKDTIEFISTWEINIAVKNTSKRAVLAYPLHKTGESMIDYGELSLEILLESDSIWRNSRSLMNMHYDLNKPANQRCALLDPNNTIKNTFICRPPFELLKFGVVKVRARYLLCEEFDNGDPYIYSNIVNLHINKYKESELGVFSYLNSKGRFDFLLAPIFFNASGDSSDVVHAEYLTKNFSTSKFTPYANLYLSHIYSLKANNIAIRNIINKNESKIEGLEALRLSKKFALKAKESKDAKIQEISVELLDFLKNILDQLYLFNPPVELEEEFTFPFKH